jgi:hypothetical protein
MNRVWAQFGVVCVLGLCSITALVALSGRSHSGEAAAADESSTIAAKPGVYAPCAPPVFTSTGAEAEGIQLLLRTPPAVDLSVPGLTHLLRLYGRGRVENAHFATGEDIVGVLTSAPRALAILGDSPLIETRHGVRVRLVGRINYDRAGESHRDVVLAALAEVGSPLNQPLTLAQDRAVTLADLLRDSLAIFHLDRGELAWTAVAYALYLPPRSHWHDREGRRYTFDDLADALMQDQLGETSCGGAHVLHALTILLRADADHAVLSRDSRERLRRHLEDSVATAVAAQHADGYWTIAWHQWPMPPMRVADTPATRLLATGHLLEWLTYLPPDLHPNASVYQSAAAWLLSTLTPTQAGAADYCATVHALCALRNLVDEADQQLDSQPVPRMATTWLP